jgi:hypothetical protein
LVRVFDFGFVNGCGGVPSMRRNTSSSGALGGVCLVMAYEKLLGEFVLDDAQLIAIGCMEIEAAQLEEYVDVALTMVMRFDEETLEIFVPQSVSLNSRLSLLYKLVKKSEIAQQYKDEFSRLYSDATRQLSQRNTVTHGSWQAPEGPGTFEQPVWPVRGQAVAVLRTNKVPAADVRKLAHELEYTKHAIMTFVIKHFPDPLPPNKLGQPPDAE